jgi:hypothetical protein
LIEFKNKNLALDFFDSKGKAYNGKGKGKAPLDELVDNTHIGELGDMLREHYVVQPCERSVGTVFQLPSPDAIYSRDKGKERR